MKSFLILLLAVVTINTDLYAAEAGMPQLDPTYWASQAFWLVLIFAILYISISKFVHLIWIYDQPVNLFFITICI